MNSGSSIHGSPTNQRINEDSRSVAPPQHDNLSVTADSTAKDSKSDMESRNFMIPTPLSSEKPEDSNI